MQHSNKIEKINNNKKLDWSEENQPKKGDKRNKPMRNNSKRDCLDQD